MSMEVGMEGERARKRGSGLCDAGYAPFETGSFDAGSGFPIVPSFVQFDSVFSLFFLFIPAAANLGCELVHAGIWLSASAKTVSAQIIVHRLLNGALGTMAPPVLRELFHQSFSVRHGRKRSVRGCTLSQDWCFHDELWSAGVPLRFLIMGTNP